MSDNLDIVRKMQKEIIELKDPILNDRRPEMLHCNSLKGFMDFLYENHDGFDPENMTILINNYEKVVALNVVNGARVERTSIIQADKVVYDTMVFNRFLTQQEAIIQLQTRCVRTDEVSALIFAISGLSFSEKHQSADDGVKQDINMTSGMQYNNGKPDSIVAIRPYRTFPEVEQPESQFLVRIDQRDGMPIIQLVETDGGMWKVQALRNIKTYLKDIMKIPEITIIG